MAYWLHSTLAAAQLYASQEQARAALMQLAMQLKGRGYGAEVIGPDHLRLTHPTEGIVEAYIDTGGPEVGGDDET